MAKILDMILDKELNRSTECYIHVHTQLGWKNGEGNDGCKHDKHFIAT